MHKIIIPLNKKIGKLTFIKEGESKVYQGTRKNGLSTTTKQRYVICKCDCGNIITLQIQTFLYGKTQTCGECFKPHNSKWIKTKIGSKFGKLTILSEDDPIISKTAKIRVVTCKCDCGVIKQYRLNNIKTRHTSSCGCLYKENSEKYGKNSFKHGKHKTSIYRYYRYLRGLCEQPNNPGYKNIGGKGIKFCERWKTFVNFFNDISKRPSLKHFLIRIDKSKNFEPNNVEWRVNYKKPKKITKKPRISRLYWNKERCYKEALKYKYRWEFGKNSRSAYDSSLRNGWMDDICSHMIKLMSNHTKEDCKLAALKYKKRVDFQKYDKAKYSKASRENWMDEICSHMQQPLSLTKRIVYVYEFPNKVAYIGLTADEEGRHKSHMGKTKKQTPVSKHILKTNLIPIKKILSDGYTDVFLAQKLEISSIKLYKKNGWTLLNTYNGGGLGGTYKYTKNACRKESLKYDNVTEFKKNKLNYYGAIVRNKWLDELTGHMKRKRVVYNERMNRIYGQTK